MFVSCSRSFIMHLLPLLLFVSTIAAADTCAPATWAQGSITRSEPMVNGALPRGAGHNSYLTARDIQPGQVNCRYSSTTKSTVNYYTCTELATKYGISIELFFELNPTLTLDCGNIQPKTTYCVAGFIEPVRATNGLCGPKNDNATCLGTDFQCCNANTWTCGNTDADCADGTCYEGACAGDKVYSTDGTCGSEHGDRLCAGVWGDCCNLDGKCGTGEGFCGIDACQSGNCTRPVVVPTNPPWMSGNTTDGTCGDENKYSCSVIYGNCCNKDNVCGSLASDCGEGCQPLWGNCSSISTGPTSERTSTSTSSSATSIRTTSTSTISTTSKPITTSTTSTSSSTTSKTTTALSSLPSCGQTCFNNMLAQSSALGCRTNDSGCLCSNVDFSNGLRDCSNGACGTDVASTVIAYGSAYCSSALATYTTPTASKTSTMNPTTTTALSSLPSCGQTCFNNMLAQSSALGCQTNDSGCLCSNADFSNGLRDCSNGACGTAVASTVIAYGSAYCSSALATYTAPTATKTSTSNPTTTTALSSLPSCGQTCFNNMVGQYSALGCQTPDPACLCSNVNFGYGLRDCSNGACGTAVASTVIAYGSAYCARATGT